MYLLSAIYLQTHAEVPFRDALHEHIGFGLKFLQRGEILSIGSVGVLRVDPQGEFVHASGELYSSPLHIQTVLPQGSGPGVGP